MNYNHIRQQPSSVALVVHFGVIISETSDNNTIHYDHISLKCASSHSRQKINKYTSYIKKSYNHYHAK